jgi:hypothetical protein
MAGGGVDRYAAAAVLLAVTAACGPDPGANPTTATSVVTTIPSTTTTTLATTTTTIATTTTLSAEEIAAQELDADGALIVALWRDFSDSWAGGVEAAAQFMAYHMHPIEECTTESILNAYQWPEGTQIEVVIDRDTIERDDGWTVPGGPGDGQVPDGRIYIMTAASNDSGTQEIEEIHSAILDGEAVFFWDCAPS